MESETLKQLDQSGADALKWLDEFMEKGLGFVEEQAPLLCQEIINLRIATSVMSIILWSMLSIAAMRVCRACSNKIDVDNPKDDDGPLVLIMIVAAGGGIGCLAGACIWIYNLVAVLVAPRIYLLEYFTDLVRRMRS